LRYDIADGNTVVQISVLFGCRNADDPPTVPTGPTAKIELLGIHHLMADDFILPPATGDYVLQG
jgi:hypothetical protein